MKTFGDALSRHLQAHAKHVQVCMKVFQQHRKEFNSVAHRVPQEALQMLQHNKKGKRGDVASASTQAKPANKWRQKSEAFRAAIRDSRVVDTVVKNTSCFGVTVTVRG